MASINQILSKQGKALTGPGNTTTVHVGNGDSARHSPPEDFAASAELRNNPYFQHMIENYSNLIYQQQQQQIQQQQQQQQQLQLQQRGSPQGKPSPSRSSNNSAATRPANQGPSWCWVEKKTRTKTKRDETKLIEMKKIAKDLKFLREKNRLFLRPRVCHAFHYLNWSFNQLS